MNNKYNNSNGTYYAPPAQQGHNYQNAPQQAYAQPQQQYAQSQYQQPYAPQPQYGDYQPYVPIKKVHKPFEKKDTAFFFLSLLASFLMIDFGLLKGVKLGFTIAYLLLFTITSVYLWKKESEKSKFSLACGVLSVAGAVTFTLYDNLLVNSIMFFLVFGLYGFYALDISGTFRRRQGNFKVLFDLAYSVFIEPFAGIEKVIGSARATSKKNKKLISAIIGIAIAIPFLLVIIPLLMRSDAAFEGLVKLILKNIGVYLVELLVAIIATPFVFSYLFSKREGKSGVKPSGNVKFIASPVSVSFLSVISITYVVYLFSQLAYFFTAFKGFLPEGYKYTASAFARRGFYEMFAICVINVIIISLAGAFTKRVNGKVSPMIKALSCFVSLFSVLLIVIAMQKMKLNISIYGLSVNRVLVTALIMMVLLMIAFFILHIIAPKISYFQPIIIICSAVFVALSFANIDARCAEYNINAYKTGKIEMCDTVAIRNSSDSALPYLIKLAKGDDKVLANNAKNQIAIYIKENDNLSLKDSNKTVKIKGDIKDFRCYNKARMDAYSMVCDYYNNLDAESKKPMIELIGLYENGYYDEEGNFFIEFTDENYSVKRSYNPQTGLYDKTEKTTEW